MIKRQNGMSLIQVMIALGLMSVIGLGVAELVVTSTRVNKRSEIKLSQLVLINELQTVTSKPGTCTEAVDGGINSNFDENVAANGGWDLKFEISGETIEANHVITNGLTINRLYYTLDNANPINNNAAERTFLGKVFISFNVADNTMGGNLQEKSIGSMFIKVSNANDEILSCEREAEVPISEVCTNNLKGTYDPATQECTLPQQAQTPSGTECTPGQSRTVNCYYSGVMYEACIDGYWTKTGSENCYQSCFTAETQIKMHMGHNKPISKVQIGEYVMGEDGAINEVYDIEVVPLGSRQLFSFNDGPHFVTAEHPFKTTLGWKSFSPEDTYREHFFMVDEIPLEAGDLLYKEGKNIEMLKKIDRRNDKSNLMVYNLRLRAAPISPYNDKDDRSNTYFANGYLVHNK